MEQHLINEYNEKHRNSHTKKCQDFFGKKYHRLTIIDVDMERSALEFERRGKCSIYVKCVCDCGVFKSCLKSHVVKGNVKSCGCLVKETTTRLNTQNKKKYKIVTNANGESVKQCSMCGEMLPINLFYKDKRGVLGGYCKKCNYDRGKKNPSTCKTCGSIFMTTQQQTKRNKNLFCSYECRDKWYSKAKLNVPIHNKESKQKLSISKKNLYANKENHPRYGKTMSPESKRKLSASLRLVMKKGIEHPRYNHSITPEERERRRCGSDYAQWRTSVYERDNYTCVRCGSPSKGDIVAHHLDGYNWCIEKRTNVDNGVTLCEECHKAFHSIYKNGNNTLQQWEEFIING